MRSFTFFLFFLAIAFSAGCNGAGNYKYKIVITIGGEGSDMDAVYNDYHTIVGRLDNAGKVLPGLKGRAATIAYSSDLSEENIRTLLTMPGVFTMCPVYGIGELDVYNRKFEEYMDDPNPDPLLDELATLLYAADYHSDRDVVIEYVKEDGREKVKELFETESLRAHLLPYGKTAFTRKTLEGDYYALYILRDEADKFLWNDHITATEVKDDRYGRHAQFALDGKGRSEFAKLTKDNVGRCLAMLIDGEVVSAPIVQQEITGGKASMSGNYERDELKVLATVIKFSPLALPVEVVSFKKNK